MAEALDLNELRIDRSRGPRKRSGPWKGRLVIAVCVGAVLWMFQRPLGNLIDRLRLPEVEVTTVVRRSPSQDAGAEGAAANGYVVARTRAALSADRPGRLVEVRVEEGSQLAKGDVVARLDHEEQDAAVARSQADLEVVRRGAERAAGAVARALADQQRLGGAAEAARADLAEAAALLDFALEAERRYQALVDQGVTEAHKRDELLRDRKAAQARVESAAARLSSSEGASAVGLADVDVARRAEAEALAQVGSSEAQLDQSLAALEKTFVRAPFDGIVVLKEAEVGEVVSPNSQGGSNARGSVATMVDFSSLEVQAEVPETSLAAVQLGGPARVYLDAFPAEPYEGHIDRIWPTADRQKATVEVRVALDQLDERLRPDMGVRVVFLNAAAADAGGPGQPVLLVPESSVVMHEGASGVFIIERGRVRFQPVRAGEPRGSRVIVEAGLGGDEELVLDPPIDLEDGDRVRVAR